MLYCTLPCYAMLYHSILFYVLPLFTILSCFILYYAVLYYAIFYCAIRTIIATVLYSTATVAMLCCLILTYKHTLLCYVVY